MKTNKTFESWYSMIKENELATVTTTETPTISNDVDTIMTSLETLAKELTEDLSGEEFNELNEADAAGPSKVMQWLWWMPKARKAQAKVNKIKLNVTDMESAAEDAPDKDQKAKITAKAKIARDQASQLQKMVDDKFNAKGELVAKVLHNEKIAGQIASIKRASGLEDDPEKLSTYKEKMAELQQKYKEDQAAIKELEPSDDDKKAEKAKRDKEEAEAKAKQKKLDDDAAAAKNKKDDKTDSGDEESSDDKSTPKKDDTEAADKSTPKKDDTEASNDTESKTDTQDTPDIKAAKEEIAKLEKDLADAVEAKNTKAVELLKGAISGKKKLLQKKTESLVIRANSAGLNELATEIESKLDWQISEGTALYLKYNEAIKKAEYTNTLNESKYDTLSIKERFSRLM